MQARNKNSVICCNIEPEPNRAEVELPNGLVKGHAYIVSTLATLPMYGNHELRLLKCINPWGTEFEWSGDWSKHSSLWQYLNDKDKRILLDEVKAKGQFWYYYSIVKSCKRAHGKLQQSTFQTSNSNIKI